MQLDRTAALLLAAATEAQAGRPVPLNNLEKLAPTADRIAQVLQDWNGNWIAFGKLWYRETIWKLRVPRK